MPKSTASWTSEIPSGFQALGNAFAYRQEQDIVLIQFRGTPATGEDIEAMLNLYERLKKERGYLLVLIDGKRSGGMTPEARKSAARLTRLETMHTACAMFNVGFATRSIAKLVFRATLLLSKLPLGPMEFFDAETEARAFLDRFRPK